MDAIILPLSVATLASRSCELEHKGGTWKLLETMASPGSLYTAKLAWGALVLGGLLILRSGLFLGVGIAQGFHGAIPWGRFGLFTLISWLVSMMIYALQQGLSLRFANQAAALVCGDVYKRQQNGQHSWTIDEAHSREIIRRGLELGINFFDTAIAYQSGTSEQYVGRALRDFVQRDEVVLATKFLPRTNEEIAAGVSGQEHIRRMLDKSLLNLGMDYVDLYIYHMWDYQTPLSVSYTHLDVYKRQSTIIPFAASML